eukprot:GHVP01052263.1.p1 GENE.GHVP01052263.1~~GHVP01052263.1.p1  ORF type:complete len:563 (-),score=121.43 GHVP01052263.1:6483-8057(-)
MKAIWGCFEDGEDVSEWLDSVIKGSCGEDVKKLSYEEEEPKKKKKKIKVKDENEEISIEVRKPKKAKKTEPTQNDKTKDIEVKPIGYVPPHKRNKSTKQTEDIIGLRGNLNRLAEGNISVLFPPILKQYLQMNPEEREQKQIDRLISEEIMNGFVTAPKSHISLISPSLAFVTAFSLVSKSLPFEFIRQLESELCRLLDTEKLDTKMPIVRNITGSLGLLYNFGLLPSRYMYSMIESLSKNPEKCGSRKLELLSLLTARIGQTLRKANPGDFKLVIDHLQNVFGPLEEDESNPLSNLAKFLFEDLRKLKHNVKDESFAMDRFERLETWLKSDPLLHQLKREVGGTSFIMGDIDQFNVKRDAKTLDAKKSDALSKLYGETDSSQTGLIKYATEVMRLTTDQQKTAFVALMGADGVLDAVERILSISNGKNNQVPIISEVILLCCLAEKEFNQFYTDVAEKLLLLPGTCGKRFKKGLRNAIAHQKVCLKAETERGTKFIEFVTRLISAYDDLKKFTNLEKTKKEVA